MSPSRSHPGILATLHQEHGEVKDLFQAMEETTARAAATRTRLLAKLVEALTPHMVGEEKAFYAALRKGVSGDEKMATVLEAFEEHAHGKSALRRLEKADPSSPEWDARLKVLKELVEHHIEEEESEVFDLAREALEPAQLRDLDERYRSRKEAALASRSGPR